MHRKGEIDTFGSPPPPRERKRAGRGGGGKSKQPATSGGGKSALEPINERPPQVRLDAATSTTDLAAQVGGAGFGQQQGGSQGQGQGPLDGAEAPKVHKAQINALAKMLSALRR